MISIGMDVGKERDPAALAVLINQGLREGSHRPCWHALEVGNIELGTPYQALADLVVGVARDFTAEGFPVVVTIDATGIGAAVVELARTAAPELHIIALTIGSGRTRKLVGPDTYIVGKHLLTETLQVALEQRGLTVADSAGAEELHRQLTRFIAKTTATGYQKHEASTGHDDLVLGLELALFIGDAMFDQHAGVLCDAT